MSDESPAHDKILIRQGLIFYTPVVAGGKMTCLAGRMMKKRTGKGLPSSLHPLSYLADPPYAGGFFTATPSSCQFPWPSSINSGLGFLSSPSRGLFDDTARFTLCYGLVFLLALSLTGTFVDTLLHTDSAACKYPSYEGTWLLPLPDFHRLEDTCLAGHAPIKKDRERNNVLYPPHY